MLYKQFLRIPVLEWLLIAAFFALIGVLLAINGGGPQFSDELWYMDAGINGAKDYQIMNYYVHIYLQKPFLELASRPVAGAKLYWSFLVTASSTLVYLCARWMNKHNTAFHSLFGVLIFYSISIFPQWIGATKVDFTSMLMATLVAAIYILAINHLVRRELALALIGFFLFMCLKSKETSIFIAVLLLGFGFNEEGGFSWKALFRSLKFTLLGFAAGAVVFMALSALIVKDALWGIRPSDWVNYIAVTLNTKQQVTVSINWFEDGIAAILFAPFLFYIISGINYVRREKPVAEKLLWLYPLLLVVFLTLAFLSNGYKTENRFILPAVPLICILAAQVFEFNTGLTKTQSCKLAWVLAVTAVVVMGLVFLFNSIHSDSGWAWAEYFNSLVFPLTLAFLLGFLFLAGKMDFKKTVVMMVSLMLIFLPRTISNFQSMLIEKPNNTLLRQMYYPFSTFSDRITYTKDMRMYISPTIPARQQMLMQRKEEIRSMFNVYFHTDAKKSNFIFPADFDVAANEYSYTDPINSIMKMNFNQAIISIDDWKALALRKADFEAVNENYNFTIDKHDLVVYLSKR